MTTAAFPWLAQDNEVEVCPTTPAASLSALQVYASALVPGFCIDDPSQDLCTGCERSWRRCKVVKRLSGVPQTLDNRWIHVKMHCAEEMYSYAVEGDATSNLEPDDPVTDGYEDDSNDEGGGSDSAVMEHLSVWLVAPAQLRPWTSIESDRQQWPVPSIAQLSVGDAVLYVDKADRSVRWESYVRRKFGDAVWLWAAGKPEQTWPSASDHHAYCCTDDSPAWRATQHLGVSHVALPFSRHLRRARHFDASRGVWRAEPPPPAFYAPKWVVLPRSEARGRTDSEQKYLPLALPEVVDSVREQLRSVLFKSMLTPRPMVPLDKLLFDTKFASERHWESVGLPSSDASVNSFIVKYVRMMVEEALQRRSKQAGLPESRKTDENCGKVAEVLHEDIEWLEREAIRWYVKQQHPAAMQYFAQQSLEL